MRDFIEALAREAGTLAQSDFKELSSRPVETKSTDRDIVTFADRDVEDFIRKRLSQTFPDHSVYGEERGGDDASGNGPRWIIDPIDGTAAYERGQHFWCVSIAYEENGALKAAAVYAPALKELFSASAGEGAFLNGEVIHVSSRKTFLSSTCSTGFACLRAGLPENNLRTFGVFAKKVREVRRYGSAALDLCMTAAGRIDFYWEYPLHLYDVAAGALILREAGGRVTDFDGGADFPARGIAASNGILHSAVLAVLRETDYR